MQLMSLHSISSHVTAQLEQQAEIEQIALEGLQGGMHGIMTTDDWQNLRSIAQGKIDGKKRLH